MRLPPQGGGAPRHRASGMGAVNQYITRHRASGMGAVNQYIIIE